MRLLKDAQFGVITFFGSNDELGDKCGLNGLPLTPSSIQMIGRFQLLKSLCHPNLCKYLDIQRGKQDMVLVISEHSDSSINSIMKQEDKFNDIRDTRLPIIAHDILTGLAYLHERNIVHRNLSLENISISSQGTASLSQYGLYYLTYCETLVPFRLGNPFYFSPEILVCKRKYENAPSVDIYAFGVVLLEILMGSKVFNRLDIKELRRHIEGVLDYTKAHLHGSMLDYYLALLESDKRSFYDDTGAWFDLIRHCLFVLPSKRPSASDLLQDPLFNKLSYGGVAYFKSGLHESFLNMRRTAYLDINKSRQLPDNIEVWIREPIKMRLIEEVHYLWKLAGSNVEIILDKKGLIKTNLPVLMLPNVIIGEYDVFGCEKQRRHITDLAVYKLSMENLLKRLKTVRFEHYYPSLEYNAAYGNTGQTVPHSESAASLFNVTLEVAQLPKVVKEKDIEYQLIRMVLFNLLLDAYPFKRIALWQESRIDIPPIYRGLVWCALLDVKGDVEEQYDSIDKETPTSTDRQIEVDIPRCHQYDELLSSPESHSKFKRILKAWVVSHPQYVYWQGLDSLCAPFLYLNFNHECLAYACLKNFIPKYLHSFFLKDNSAVMQEYLAVFNHLIGYHDPLLYFHLHDIGFSPDLYAIPWFLTMFAHLMPLPKLFHLWDTLLLGNNSFPLCVGVAILLQMRDTLLSFSFNDCILLFSDMPEIDIEQCVRTAVKIFCMTPKSATYRQFMPQPASAQNQDRDKTKMFMDPVPLSQLRKQHCPRICADEMLVLQRRKESGSAQTSQNLLCVDIRPFEEFVKGTFPLSVNVPYNLLKVDGVLNFDGLTCNRLENHKGNLTCVMGLNNGDKRAYEIAEHLMRSGYPQVVTLHNGIEVLRQHKLLIPYNSL